MNRALSKVNYRIHTDAVKENLIPPELTPEQIAYTYASEADLLNVALFGQTAKQWKNNNPGKKGNLRDDANLNQADGYISQYQFISGFGTSWS